jgi:hypothetical protein
MKNIDKETIIQIALIAGIVTIASLGMSGWGWLVFCLLITL